MSDEIEELPDRVAGHNFSEGCKVGVGREPGTGDILKVVDGDVRGKRELNFYDRLYSSDHVDIVQLRNFCPPFHGTRVIRGRLFMRLGNVTYDGSNVMDVKIGAITWGPDATEQKIELEKCKYEFREYLKFRILGFHATKSRGQKVVLDKSEARKITPDEVRSRISLFLSPDNNSNLLSQRQKQFLKQLEDIKIIFQHQKMFQFISSSILLSYSNGLPQTAGDPAQEAPVKVTMIDFAHVHDLEEGQLDMNYLEGITSFIKYFSDLGE